MHRFILLAGSIIASSIGLALAGLILREAVKSSHRRIRLGAYWHPALPASDLQSRLSDLGVRGYDTLELRYEDTLARLSRAGGNRELQ